MKTPLVTVQSNGSMVMTGFTLFHVEFMYDTSNLASYTIMRDLAICALARAARVSIEDVKNNLIEYDYLPRQLNLAWTHLHISFEGYR